MPIPHSAAADVLLAALAHRDRWQYEAVADLCDARSAAEWHHTYCTGNAVPTVEAILAAHDGMTRAAAEAVVRRRTAEKAAADESLARAIPGVGSFAELEALTPREFLRRWLEVNDPRYPPVAHLRRVGRPVPAEFLETPPTLTYEVTEVIPTEPDAVRIRYQLRWAAPDGDRVELATEETLRRDADGRWRLIVRPMLLNTPGERTSVLTIP